MREGRDEGRERGKRIGEGVGGSDAMRKAAEGKRTIEESGRSDCGRVGGIRGRGRKREEERERDSVHVPTRSPTFLYASLGARVCTFNEAGGSEGGYTLWKELAGGERAEEVGECRMAEREARPGGTAEGEIARRAAEGGEASHGSFSADRCATSVISRE